MDEFASSIFLSAHVDACPPRVSYLIVELQPSQSEGGFPTRLAHSYRASPESCICRSAVPPRTRHHWLLVL